MSMAQRKSVRCLTAILYLIAWHCSLVMQLSVAACAAGRDIEVPDVQFQPIRPTRAITIKESVDLALRNFPAIQQKVFKLRAAKANVARQGTVSAQLEH